MNALPPNLVAAWLAAETADGSSIAAALDRLNEATGSRYDHSRLSTWRTGTRPVPDPARRYMLARALPHLIAVSGLGALPLPPQTLDALTAALTPPNGA